MTKNLFFASAAKAALALATVVMMSAAFTACSSSNNDDDGGGGIPPSPEPKAGIVTLDGEEKAILKAEYDPEGDGNYRIYLILSADEKEQVVLHINKDVFGTPIKLTEKAKKNADAVYFYWTVDYYKSNGEGGNTKFIEASGAPEQSVPVFNTGTLEYAGSIKGTLNIRLENGRVKGKDGKEHTLTISYSGKITEL